MCHDDDSRPPSPPTIGEVSSHGRATLTGADGTTFAIYDAAPVDGHGRNVVILPDVRGLHPYYEALAVRFAEAGFQATAFDYFGRTQGTDPRGEDFDWKSEMSSLTPDLVRSDAAAAIAHIAARNSGPTYTLGFCFGGSMSWRLSASDLDLAGCMGFYGMPGRIADVEEQMTLPTLLLVAGADGATPVEEFEALDARMIERGQPHEMHVYAGAPHSFFDRSFGDWREACTDAWGQILSFTGVA